MLCSKCGYENASGNSFCIACGSRLEEPRPAAEENHSAPASEPVPQANTQVPPTAYQSAPVYSQAPVYNPQPTYYAPAQPQMPTAHKPLSPWAYYGYQVLFSLPVIGFIMLLVFSFDDGNIHRRNFARSYWCGVLISIVLIVLAVVLGASMGLFDAMNDAMNSIY